MCALMAMSISAWTMDDVDTVANGKSADKGGYTLAFEETLRLGPDDADAFLWPGMGTSVQVDDRGWMYVTAVGENTVTVIDADGNFVRTIGQSGQGPGEYQMLASFQILADGRGVAFESMGPMSSISWYDKDLNFVEKGKLGKQGQMIQAAYLDPAGERCFAQYVSINPSEGTMLNQWVVMDLDGGNELALSNFEGPMPNQQITASAENFAKFLSSMLKPGAQGLAGFATFGPDGHTYTAVARNYEITVWDADMNKLRVITRDYEPIAMTDEEIEAVVSPIAESIRMRVPSNMGHLFAESTIRRAVEMADFPPVKPPINGMVAFDDGHLGVIHNFNLAEQKMRVDLFDAEGRYRGDFTLPAESINSAGMVFKDGHLYRIEVNEDDENVLVRYKYKQVPLQ